MRRSLAATFPARICSGQPDVGVRSRQGLVVGTVIRIRAYLIVALAIVMTALLALLSPVTQLVVKLTATGLFMDGTGQPLAIPYNTPSYIST